MIKQVIATVAIFLALLGAGFAEIFVIKSDFAALEQELTQAYAAAREETLTESQFEDIRDDWKVKRERVEFFLNHLDFTEVDFRMAECGAYVKQRDFASAGAQLEVLIELTRHIPHMLMPTPEHVL